MQRTRLNKDVSSQKTYWIRALPGNWKYMPQNLPEYIGSQVQLTEAEIKHLVKEALHGWSEGETRHLPAQQIIPHLRKLCLSKELDWNTIQENISKLMEVRKDSNTPAQAPITEVAAEPIKETAKESKKDDRKKLAMLETGKAAARVWTKQLPDGFEFEYTDTPQKLGDFYALNTYEIEEVMETAVQLSQTNKTHAENEEIITITSSVHLQPALDQLLQSSGKETLLRKETQQTMEKSKKKIVQMLSPIPYRRDGSTAFYYRRYLPEGFAFERTNLPVALNLTYKVNEPEIEQIVTRAVEIAKENDEQLIKMKEHISPAIHELSQKLGVNLMRSNQSDIKRKDL